MFDKERKLLDSLAKLFTADKEERKRYQLLVADKGE